MSIIKPYNDEVINPHTIRLSGLLRFATNDKQKKHPPAPFKGGTLFVIFRLFENLFSLGVY